MTRRELLRIGGSTALLGALSPLDTLLFGASAEGSYLFLDPRHKARVLANVKTPLLKPLYDAWAAKAPRVLLEAIETYEKTGSIVRDFQKALVELESSIMVQFVEPTAERLDSLLYAIERIIAQPYWDYFRDGGQEVLGIQRASFATVRLLMAREFLASDISADLDRRILQAVAAKGCEACFATVFDMDHPETVKGWDFDEAHAGFYDLTMERWPIILGANNLRAAPTGALGLGALALLGSDPRARLWLDTAVASTERFYTVVSKDGSFYEGISYLDYSLRTTLPFMDAHTRLIGDRDWTRCVNVPGMIEFTQAMQLGKNADGSADVVNFSDSRNSVFPGALTKLGDYCGNALGAYAADNASQPGWIYDFLWYRPDGPRAEPDTRLLNWRSDLSWIVTRSGWSADDAVMAFKSGGPANHEHADRNHLIYKIHGERLLNDHFGASYDRRHPGWLMRHAVAHNCILIDGRGHPYIDGREGTNDSKAYSVLIDYEDRGDLIWWTSDASAAYILDNPHVTQVLRTVIFAKPATFLVYDQIQFRYRPQIIDARYYPDNADGKARLDVDGNRFRINRPNAALHALVASGSGAAPRRNRLQVPADVGDFPCIEIHAPEALEHNVLTLFTATKGSPTSAPDMSLASDREGWRISAPGLEARLTPQAYAPAISLL